MNRSSQDGSPSGTDDGAGVCGADASISTRRADLKRLVGSTVLVVLVMAGAIGLGTGFGSQPGGQGASSDTPLVGQPAPDLPTESLAGGGPSIDLSGDEVLLVNFWASWCPPCREEFPVLLEAQRELGDQGLQVVAINSQDQAAAARGFLEEMGAREAFPQLADPDGDVAVDWGVFGLPETFVVAADGTVSAKAVGVLDEDWIADEVESLLESDS